MVKITLQQERGVQTPVLSCVDSFLLGAVAKLHKATISFVMPVCPSVRPSVCLSVYPTTWNSSAPTGRIFMKFHIWVFFENIIFVIDQLSAQICFIISLLYSCTCFEYYVLIIRRSKLYYTASGIITLRQVSGQCDDTRSCIIQFWPPDDEHTGLETCRGI